MLLVFQGAAGMGTLGTLGAQGTNSDTLLFQWLDNINFGADPASPEEMPLRFLWDRIRVLEERVLEKWHLKMDCWMMDKLFAFCASGFFFFLNDGIVYAPPLG